jgi:hypothetical protein
VPQRHLMTAFALFLLLAGPLPAAWEPDFRMTHSLPGQEPSSMANRWLAASGGVLHVVWCDSSGGDMDVFYKRSQDGGATWDADVDLADDHESSQWCAVAASGRNVHVVWDGDRDGNQEIYIRSSSDGGSTWSGTTRLTVDDSISKLPCVACWQNHVYVTWLDGRTPSRSQVFIKMSSDNGATWTDDAEFTDPEIGARAVIAVDDSMVHAVWSDFREMTFNVFYKRSFDHGATWSADASLSSDMGVLPSISVSGMDVHVVWTTIENELVYLRSTDGGTMWGGDAQLSMDADASTCGSVVSSGPLVHVVWQENRYASESELAYRLSRDHGNNWGSEVRLTEAEGASTFPSLAADGDAVHVSWLDARDTLNEVYYKRNPNGNGGVAEGRTERTGTPASPLRPNPVARSTRVVGHEDESFVVFDATGRPVQQCSGGRVGAGLAAGVYLLRSTDGEFGPVRFVKLQ